jgi:hypothetical protein
LSLAWAVGLVSGQSPDRGLGGQASDVRTGEAGNVGQDPAQSISRARQECTHRDRKDHGKTAKPANDLAAYKMPLSRSSRVHATRHRAPKGAAIGPMSATVGSIGMIPRVRHRVVAWRYAMSLGELFACRRRISCR